MTIRLAVALACLGLAVWLAGCAEKVFERPPQRVPSPSAPVKWPTPAGEKALQETITVGGAFDGGMVRYYGVGDLGTSDQEEGQQPLFALGDGATLSNVILGDPAADGIHCDGSCTLNNVWWERVGEDAATFRGPNQASVMTINGGGASGAKDKVFQANGAGTIIIKNFYVEHFGKLVRSCGNCSAQARRHVIIENLTAVTDLTTKSVAGVNENYGDVAEFRGVSTIYDKYNKFTVCLKYLGNSDGREPKALPADGPDGKTCIYDNFTVVVRR
jgi:hypothetical protein